MTPVLYRKDDHARHAVKNVNTIPTESMNTFAPQLLKL